MANKDVVFKMYEHFGKGDMEAIKRDCFHKEMTWNMPGHHPLSGAHKGVDAVIAFFGALFKAGIEVPLETTHFGELDNGTVVEKHIGYGNAEGRKYTFPTCTTYEFKDGKIFNVQVHSAVQHEVDQYFWLMFKLKGVPARLAD